MKRPALLIGILLILSIVGSGQDPADIISGETITYQELQNYLNNPVLRAQYNNDPFDNERSVKLRGKMPYVSGEILNPGQAYADKLDRRTVAVKEFIPGRRSNEPEFMGAFLYTGYSLSDLIKDYVVSKINSDEFGLNTDVYVLVQNDKGESAVFSWGELFMSNSNHDIIIATHVQPVFPTDSEDDWPVPQRMRLIAANDFLTVRNIEAPSKIIIRSFPKSFPGSKGIRPLYSPELKIIGKDNRQVIIEDQSAIGKDETDYDKVFFGMHKGLRGDRNFKGTPFRKVLAEAFDFSKNDLSSGLIAIGAKDAYRVVFSLSEIMNRTDMAEVLLIDAGDDEDGRFIVHPGNDFFADRHMKGAKLGYIINVVE